MSDSKAPGADQAPPFNWRAVLPIHPAAELFPLMSEAELKELAADIRQNGLRTQVVTWSGADKDGRALHGPILLDGRNRLDALALLGLLFETTDHHLGLKKWTNKNGWRDQGARIEPCFVWGDDPYAYVISANVHRRHLTAEQKRDLIVKLLKATPEKSNRQIAKMVDASHPHVAKVREQAEKTGDVETVTTSTDTKGRKQPAKRTRAAKQVEAEKPIETDAAEAKPQPVCPCPSCTLPPDQHVLGENQNSKVEATGDAAGGEAKLAALDEVVIGGVEDPAIVHATVLDSIKQSRGVAEAYRKILKVSPFDRETKKEISDAIELLIRKWRAVQSTLAASEPPPDDTPTDPGPAPDGEPEPKVDEAPADTVPEPEEYTVAGTLVAPATVRARRKEKYPETEEELLAAGFVKSQQCGVYMRPWPSNWERISAGDLASVIRRTQAFGAEHGCEDQLAPQLQKMRERFDVLWRADRAAARASLRKADRAAERASAGAEAP